MHIYIFNTDIGTFEITNYKHHSYYDLLLNDEKLGEYASAQDAAEDVYSFNTNYIQWDQLEGSATRVPSSLAQWQEVTALREDELPLSNNE